MAASTLTAISHSPGPVPVASWNRRSNVRRQDHRVQACRLAVGHGVHHLLCRAALQWCRERGIAACGARPPGQDHGWWDYGLARRGLQLGHRGRRLMTARSGPAPTVTIEVAGREHVAALLPLIEAHARFERTAATCTADALRSALAEPDALLFAWLAIDEMGRAIG